MHARTPSVLTVGKSASERKIAVVAPVPVSTLRICGWLQVQSGTCAPCVCLYEYFKCVGRCDCVIGYLAYGHVYARLPTQIPWVLPHLQNWEKVLGCSWVTGVVTTLFAPEVAAVHPGAEPLRYREFGRICVYTRVFDRN